MISFTNDAWQDYISWQQQDNQLLKRINMLIKDIIHNPYDGIGKPEPLRYQYSGTWSRRINDEHRIVYYLKEDHVYIVSVRDHYK